MTVELSVVDSHTGGEPTRVITGGFPELAGATLAERRDDLTRRFGHLATKVVSEPRGSEAMVAAVLLPPEDPSHHAGVVFFDRSGALGMCGHGTIGLVETLRFLGRIGPGSHLLDTPVGPVETQLHADGRVSVANVPSRRLAHDVRLDVPGFGSVTGDVAWGGNTFFLVGAPELDPTMSWRGLLGETESILLAAHAAGFSDVDHVELFGAPTTAEAHSRNFVLCPSGTYDRSPCGTGTSAKLACLAADGLLAEGETWVQESITGSTFSARYAWVDRDAGEIAPVVTGRAEVVAVGQVFVA